MMRINTTRVYIPQSRAGELTIQVFIASNLTLRVTAIEDSTRISALTRWTLSVSTSTLENGLCGEKNFFNGNQYC
jgi:hypothetical protein